MSGGRPRLAAAVSCVLAAAALSAVARGDGGSPAPAPPAWAPKPADLLLMLSGNERGLLKPCGCFEPQRGGLERRAAMWERARAAAKASAALSVGETLSPGIPAQSDLKAELFRAAIASMGYAGSLLGPGDLSPLAPALSQPWGGEAEKPRPPLNVRVKPGGMLAQSAGVDPVLRFEVGGQKVRAVSVVDPTAREALTAAGIADAVIEPALALEALSKEPGLLVVAAHCARESIAMVVRAAGAKADAAIVVDVAGEVAFRKPVEGWTFGRPLLVTFDGMGKEAGLVRLSRAGGKWTAAYEAVALDPFLEEGESKARGAVTSLFAAYRKRVRDAGVLASFQPFSDGPAAFVGNEACAACHAAVVESWKGTSHAHALETLAAKDSSWDPECVRCHVVGWRRDRDDWSKVASSFRTPDATPALGGVGCESCHGPGSLHVKEPDRKDLFGAWRQEGKMWRDLGRSGCAECHDVENSRDFNLPKGYEEYRPAVDHSEVPKEKRTVRPR